MLLLLLALLVILALFFLGGSFPAPSSIATTDAFRTRNQFYGGQVGVRGEYCLGSLVVSATSKIALGNMHEVVEVRGTSTWCYTTFELASGQHVEFPIDGRDFGLTVEGDEGTLFYRGRHYRGVSRASTVLLATAVSVQPGKASGRRIIRTVGRRGDGRRDRDRFVLTCEAR